MINALILEIFCCIVIGFILFSLIFTLIDQYHYKKKSNINLKNKHVVITGGSSGIGKSLAIQSVLRGASVTIIARDEEKLDIAKREIIKNCIYSTQRVFTVSLDISSGKYEEIEKTLHLIEQEGGSIFMLINCAGTAVCGQLEDISPEDITKLLELNCIGSIMVTKAVIESMKSRSEGHIVFTSSQAGLVGIYGLSAYSASKFALRGFAEALHMETQCHGIKITIAFPPDTDTPGYSAENQGKPKETKLICETSGLFQPQAVANQIIKDSLGGRFVSFVGADGFMLTTLMSGMSPCNSILQFLTEVLLMGAFRIVAVFYVFSFKRIIQKCMVAKNQSKKAQ